MAVEAATFEGKTTPTIQRVTSSAPYVCHGRVLAKALKARRGIRTDKELHFSLSALPRQDQRMQAGRRLHTRVKDVGKRLFGPKRDAIQLECPARGGGDYINLAAFKRRMICRSENLPDVIIRGSHRTTNQTDGGHHPGSKPEPQ